MIRLYANNGQTTEGRSHKLYLKSVIATLLAIASLLVLLSAGTAEAATKKTAQGWFYPTDAQATVTHGGDFLDNGCGANGARAAEGKDFYLSNRIHIGTDQPAHLGWPVYAVDSGTVTQVMPNWDQQGNDGVAIRHTTASGKTFIALYGHIKSSVRTGQSVTGGSTIGKIGSYSHGAHLHFGIFPNGLPSSRQGSVTCAPGVSIFNNTNGAVNAFAWLARNPNGVAKATATVQAKAQTGVHAVDLCTDRKGRMHLFALNSSGRVVESYERTVGGSNFSSWKAVSSQTRLARGDIACAKNQDGNIALFYIGTDAKIYSTMQNSSLQWSTSQTSGLQAHDAIAAERGQNGKITVMYNRYKTLRLLTLEQRSPNSQVFYLDVSFPRDKTAMQDIELARNRDGRLEASFIGTDNRMYGAFQRSPNSDQWYCCFRHGSDSVKDGLGLAANRDGRLEQIYIRSNGAVYSKFQRWAGGTWWCCTTIGRSYASRDVALNIDTFGRLHSLRIESNGSVHHAHQYGAGSGWTGWSRR